MLATSRKNSPGLHGAGTVRKSLDSKSRLPCDGEMPAVTEINLCHSWSNLFEDPTQRRSSRIIDGFELIKRFRPDPSLWIPHVARP